MHTLCLDVLDRVLVGEGERGEGHSQLTLPPQPLHLCGWLVGWLIGWLCGWVVGWVANWFVRHSGSWFLLGCWCEMDSVQSEARLRTQGMGCMAAPSVPHTVYKQLNNERA